jgi:very-short-patch-repair endonuclease
VLVGERLVIQLDGFAHHLSAAQRGRDIAHDAELRLRGSTVLRFGYAQVIYDWPTVERTVARAVAAGLHLAR